jgi:hypothetical protein
LYNFGLISTSSPKLNTFSSKCDPWQWTSASLYCSLLYIELGKPSSIAIALAFAPYFFLAELKDKPNLLSNAELVGDTTHPENVFRVQ